MMRKSVFALAAVLALGGSLTLGTDAFARGGGGHGGGGHGGGGHVGGGHVGGGHFGGGHFGGGHVGHVAVHGGRGGHGPVTHGHGPGPVPGHTRFVRGHQHHFWHGRWWDYGVGPCWVWSDVFGEYVWVCF